MQDDAKSYRAEQKQRRHQDQPHDQEIKAAPGRIFDARIEHNRRWRDDRFNRRLDCICGRG